MHRFAGLQLLSLILLATLTTSPPKVAAPVTAPAPAAVTEWVLHYDPQFADELREVHAGLLDALPDGSHVLVGMADDGSSTQYLELVGSWRAARHHVEFLPVPGAVSPWARDRYLAFSSKAGRLRIVLPADGTVHSSRTGDLAVGRRIGQLHESVELLGSSLAIEGGNVLVDTDSVLVGVTILEQNAVRGIGVEAVKAELLRLFERRPVLLGDPDDMPPHDHIDMFVALASPGCALVADPRLAAGYFGALDDLGLSFGELADIGTISRDDRLVGIEAYDAVAAQLEEAGYRVRRVPVIHTVDGETVTWTNAVVDSSGPTRRVWIPAYGMPMLDRMAQRIWRQEGFEVRPVDCRRVIAAGGALRCLTNFVQEVAGPKPRR